MRRYKGRASTKVMVRDFPHVVEIPAPIGGLGKQIDAMHAFHGQRGTQARLAPRRRDDERQFVVGYARGDQGGRAKNRAATRPRPAAAQDGTTTCAVRVQSGVRSTKYSPAL